MNNDYTIVDNNLYQDYDYLYEVLDSVLEHEHVSNAIFSVIYLCAIIVVSHTVIN